MAFRSHQEIQRLQALRRLQSTDAAVRGLPPGYIEGYQLSIVDNAPQLSPGIVNVAGSIIERNNSIRISVNEWEALKVSGFHYYIYMKREGDITVNPLAPSYNTAYRAKYHTTQPWRYLGLFFVSSTGDIVFSRSYAYDQRDHLVIAPEGYPLYADYYCDGTRDEEQFQDAIDYLSEAYGGGKISITEAKGLTNDAYQIGVLGIQLKSNIVIDMGRATIERNCSDTTQYVFKIDSSENGTGVWLINGKIKAIDSNQRDAIYFDEVTECVIDGVTIEDFGTNGVGNGIRITSGSLRCRVVGCIVKNCCSAGIRVSADYSLVKDCYVEANGLPNQGNVGIVIGAYGKAIGNTVKKTWEVGIVDAGKECIIVGNYIYNITRQGTGGGIEIGEDYGLIGNNQIIKCGGPGIDLIIGANANIVIGNACRQNENLMDESDCEDGTDPSIFAEGSNKTDTTTSTNSDSYQGDASQQLSKDTASGAGDGTYEFHNTDSDLHGMSDGETYKLDMWIKIVGDGNGSADKILSTELTIEIGDTTGSWTYTQATIAATYDAWQNVTVSREIRSGATDAVVRLVMDSAAEQSSLVRIDDVWFFVDDVSNPHDNNFEDNGTGTLTGNNSWEL